MKIQWEYDIVERPFCEQLQTMGWEWIEGDPDLPETTERSSSSEGVPLLSNMKSRSPIPSQRL